MAINLRVCSYNIHKGFCAANRRPILPELRHSIRAVDADLVFLQEVVGEKAGDNFDYPQFEYLADQVWSHYVYGRNAIYQKGHHGNAILSKYPFLGWDNIDVSRWWFSQRGILFGKLSVGVYVACVHFGLFQAERRLQLQSLLTLLSDKVGEDAPLIVAGDFNDWNSCVDTILKEKYGFSEACSQVYGTVAKTFPARFPLFRMDRIYYRNIALNDAEVLSGNPWARLSDHCALYASFSLR